MGSGNAGAAVRLLALIAIAVGLWLIGKYDTGIPAPKDLGAPATEFSAARANRTLARLLGPEIPHPISSVENGNVRERIRAEFAALGINTRVETALGCMARAKRGYFSCGTTKDIIADVVSGDGKAVVMLAHYDSVPAGPGAGDDESGVATILESVRAIKARGITSKHPVIALITDGEEAGLLGAAAWLNNPKNRARVGVVVNVEARGNQGPSLLFQTSPGDSRLIDLYARNVPEVATSSLFAVVYKTLPNDTDLTVFLNYGLTGVNFAFSGNVAHYHTPLDRRENLSLGTLQHHGDNMLGMTSALMQTDFESLKGPDAIYISLFGKWLPRLSAGWALPLAVLSLLLVLLAGFLSRTQLNSLGQWAAALAMPVVLLLGSAAAGWVIFTLAQLVSGQPDPSYANPMLIRVAVGFGVLAATVFASRMAQPRLAALSVWLWFALSAVVTAALIPGLSPYFIFPVLVASVLLVIQSRLSGAWNGLAGDIALFLAALPALIIWLALSGGSEDVMGYVLHPLITTSASFAAMTLLPLLAARRFDPRPWLLAGGGALIVALVVAVVAGTQPAYSERAPQRLAIALLDDHATGKAQWVALTQAKLPSTLRAAAAFSAKPEKAYVFGPVYVAPAGAARFTPPSALIDNKPDGDKRRITLSLQGTSAANQMVLLIPGKAHLRSIEIDGQMLKADPATDEGPGVIIGCVSSDCRTKTITLELASRGPVDITLGEQRLGLPPDGQKIAAARPREAITSQNGDTTLVLKKLTIR